MQLFVRLSVQTYSATVTREWKILDAFNWRNYLFFDSTLFSVNFNPALRLLLLIVEFFLVSFCDFLTPSVWTFFANLF